MEKQINRLLWLFVALIIFGVVFSINFEFNDKKSEVINREDVYCLAALCLRDNTVGHSCIELEPRMVKVVISEEDANATRILIESNNDESCK